MALLPHERQQIGERLENLEQLAHGLARIRSRGLGPEDAHRVRDAEAAVNQAIPWVRAAASAPPEKETTAYDNA